MTTNRSECFLFFVLILFILIVSCVSATTSDRKFSESSMSINIKANDLSNTLDWKIVKWNGRKVFTYYDYNLHQILFYDTDNYELLNSIQLQHEGPDQVRINSFVLMDSLVACIGQKNVYYVDQYGKVIGKLKFSDIDHISGIAENMDLIKPNSFFFDGISDQFPSHMYPFVGYSSDDQSGELITAYANLVSRQIEYFRLPQVPSYHEKLNYLKKYLVLYKNFVPYLSFIDDKIYISFPLSGELCSCVYENCEEWECYLPNSILNQHFNLNLSYNNDIESLKRMTEGNPHFGSLHYDRYRNKFIRVSWLPKTDEHHRSIISVYSENLDLEFEQEIPKGVVPKRLSIQEEGLFFKERAEEEDQLAFRIFSYQ